MCYSITSLLRNVVLILGRSILTAVNYRLIPLLEFNKGFLLLLDDYDNLLSVYLDVTWKWAGPSIDVMLD